MYTALRELFFLLPAEASHHLAMNAIATLGRLPGRACPPQPADRGVDLFGLHFANRAGLAAGLDKDAIAVEGLAKLGFGFIEVGTVTPRPQPGNPQPRLFRLPEHNALINRMGFNSAGLDVVAKRLAGVRERNRLGGALVGVNLGKNKDTPLEKASDDYVAGVRGLADVADYFTLNLSSPNTPGLRSLQFAAPLRQLLEPVCEAVNAASVRRPVLVKVSPDLADEDLALIVEVLIEFAIDGVIATNTTINRDAVAGHRLANEAGGLSGAPLTFRSRSVVGKISAQAAGRLPVVGVGGIRSAGDARAMLEAGASLVQIYTGFIYEGPALVRTIAKL